MSVVTMACNDRCGASITVEGEDASWLAMEWMRKHTIVMHNSTAAQMTERLSREGWDRL